MSRSRIGIVGAGSIGVGLAIVFARAGADVRVFDVAQDMLASVPERVAERVELLRDAGLADHAPLMRHIAVVSTMADCVAGAELVLECVPENLELKRAVFAQLSDVGGSESIFASVSSAFGASQIAEALPARERCLVIHPANPPYLVPVVEVVPAPFTASDVVARADELLAMAGMIPVVLRHEITGFVYNRLQGAVLREAYCLVRDGVVDVEGLDTIVREGLGPRWAIIGPFETADLNTRGGIEAHAARLGPAYERMGAERGQHDPWTAALVADVTAQRRELLPLAEWDARTLWRDRHLAALRRHLDCDIGRRTRTATHNVPKEQG